MIVAVGIDIVDLDRFQSLLNRWGNRFPGKVLTDREIDLCRQKASSGASMAGRFAAKEALIKCLPTDQGLIWRWHEVEILSHEDGKPMLQACGQIGNYLKGYNVHISISHSKTNAVAMAVLEKEGGL